MSLVPINLGVPTGTVMWYAGKQVPIGWLLCDGGTFSSLEYPVLASYLGNTFGQAFGTDVTLPDLVGKFIRGYGGEAGREFGSTQEDSYDSHYHGIKDTVHNHTITDPKHFHDTSNTTHTHTTSGTHSHVLSNQHRHGTTYKSAGYAILALKGDSTEAFYVGYAYCAESHGGGFFCPLLTPTTKKSSNSAVTGITMDANFTGIVSPSDMAQTGVILGSTQTGITVNSGVTDISVDDFGAPNTRPVNTALLPIIRT